MLRKLYKLTNQDMRTHDNTQWVLGEWIVTDGKAMDLCNPSWVHAYQDPYIATLFNSIHGNFTNPRLFEAEGDGEFLDDYGMKCGVTKLRLVKEIPLPVVTDEQKIKIVLLVADRFFKSDYLSCLVNGSSISNMSSSDVIYQQILVAIGSLLIKHQLSITDLVSVIKEVLNEV